MFGRGDDDGVDFLEFEKFFGNESDARRGAVGLGVECDGAFAIDGPKIADGDHLHVLRLTELSDHAVEFGAATADADVTDGNTVVRTGDAAVGERGGANGSGRGREQCTLL